MARAVRPTATRWARSGSIDSSLSCQGLAKSRGGIVRVVWTSISAKDLDDSEPWLLESDFESECVESECDWEESWSEVSYCSAFSRQSTCASMPATRWEEAQQRAESIAKQYKKPVAPVRKPQVVQVVALVEAVEPVVSRVPALLSPPLGHGSPPLPQLHDEVLAFAGPEAGSSSRPVPKGSVEYVAVTEYLKQTIGLTLGD